MSRAEVLETAEKVAQLLAESGATELDMERIFREIAPSIGGRSAQPVPPERQGDREWLRFDLYFEPGPEQDELYQLLDRLRLTRRELALIVLGLRARPGFALADFDT